MKFKIVFTSFFILALFFSSPLLKAQSGMFLSDKKEYVEILGADYLESTRPGEQKLVGHVRLKQGNVMLACDSAFIYEKNNDFYAYGHVYMNKRDSVKTYCDVMKYYGEKKLTIFSGNVRMISDKTIIETDQLYYQNEKNNAYYLDGANIKADKAKIYSKKGYYNTSTKLINFKKNVVVKTADFSIISDTLTYHTPTQKTMFNGPTNIISKSIKIYCEAGYFDELKQESVFRKNAKIIEKAQIIYADSIHRNSRTYITDAYKNVRAIDTVEHLAITGNHGIFYEKAGKSVMTENAMLEQLIDNDTLFLHADTLKALNDTVRKEKKIYAYYGVRFFRKDLQGSCDSMTYFPSDSLIRLYREPVIWSGESQITGDYIELFIYGGKIRELRIHKNGFIISNNGPDTYDQIKGRDMIGYFDDGKMKKMKVTGNGQTIYYVKENDGSYVGANQADCSNLIITFKDSKVSKIKFLVKPVATFHPIDKVNVDKLKLENFRWRSKEKPATKEDLLD
ncbi:MAG: OstA-like protein [Flavobacteriales bacterium]